MAHKVCPFWLGYLLASPLRAFAHDPQKILRPHVQPGMTVLDVGSAMGFFSLPLARMVGPDGRVVCVDLQQKMLRALEKRARRAGVFERLEPVLCTPQSLCLDRRDGTIDFALAFAVVHEVPDQERLFAEIARALKLGALLLVAEPVGHVRADAFAHTEAAAAGQGFTVVERPGIKRAHAALLRKAGRSGQMED
jgi:ubiquinone/menaquinone biosynthesis C-methylase UbiE